MPKISILSETSYGGAKFLDFAMDGKRYVALPKKDTDQSWLEEFKELLKFSEKYNLNPFATPLKKDPLKADKYKKMRMFDRVKYSWNDDTSIKAGPRKGLRHYIDVTPKEDLDKFLEKREDPKIEQLKMKLAKDIYMKESRDQDNLTKDSDFGMRDRARRKQDILLPRAPATQQSQYHGGPVEEIINPYIKKTKVIPETAGKPFEKVIDPKMVPIKKACIDKLEKIANELESKGLIIKAFVIDRISDILDSK